MTRHLVGARWCTYMSKKYVSIGSGNGLPQYQATPRANADEWWIRLQRTDNEIRIGMTLRKLYLNVSSKMIAIVQALRSYWNEMQLWKLIWVITLNSNKWKYAAFAWHPNYWWRNDNCDYIYEQKYPGPWFNIKMSSYRYRKSHCGDKTVVRSSYLHNGISYTGKMASLYWIGAQVFMILQ